ncbi:M20/M25/M40 family metallo-hydrolase [Rhodobacteraceae bacterium B1Z28]|uniref:M20/M25/M40 family metallo-hydrolase n=1 Tax=Ruegeria haliotis TaxID=2747601 RepID=A0ABX2PX47_9RHOB|nr:M20/M25/M40 family metallo-hydrolase [Ruegeria haliotis]NVO58205.1 M20/M25/M40 family metallo-hydrolase [Ruegeria haliotis]
MPPITRAIVMLDQASGALRLDQSGQVLGLDVAPGLSAALEASRSAFAGFEITLVASQTDTSSGFSDNILKGFEQLGMQITSVPPITYAKDSGDALAGLEVPRTPTAFVSADRRLRGDAEKTGFLPAPHPLLLPMMARGHAPIGARLTGPRDTLQRFALQRGLLPMSFQPSQVDDDWALIALMSAEDLAEAAIAQFGVLPLAYDPQTEDLLWARLDGNLDEMRAALKGRSLVYAEQNQVLISLKADEDANAFHVHGAHGHSEFLAPDSGLLQPPRADGFDFETPEVGRLPEILESVRVRPDIRKAILRLRPSCATVTASYKSDLDRYTGVTDLDAHGSIASRHSAHPDNKRAEAQLMNDLRAMGYSPWCHDFTHAGQVHSNIIADLPGVGRFRIRREILERYRRILRDPRPRPWNPVIREIERDFPGQGFGERLRALSDAEIRYDIERILKLEPWFPWWQLKCPMPGLGARIVIVGAHMDSTAGFEPDYSAGSDAAPGCDDNGSGVAALLSLARYFRSLAGQLTHTVRFCFFNAEESGLIGSKAYAAELKSHGAPIKGVVCADMIGFNSDASRLFEVHAGYTDPAVRDLSIPLADKLAAAAAEYGVLAPAQIYKGTSWNGAPDRSVYDGAINRSDHAAFHQHGYGAVLASEDFFANYATEPSADPNPNYHRQSDQVIDLAYARDITCAVGRMVTLIAS